MKEKKNLPSIAWKPDQSDITACGTGCRHGGFVFFLFLAKAVWKSRENHIFSDEKNPFSSLFCSAIEVKMLPVSNGPAVTVAFTLFHSRLTVASSSWLCLCFSLGQLWAAFSCCQSATSKLIDSSRARPPGNYSLLAFFIDGCCCAARLVK